MAQCSHGSSSVIGTFEADHVFRRTERIASHRIDPERKVRLLHEYVHVHSMYRIHPVSPVCGVVGSGARHRHGSLIRSTSLSVRPKRASRGGGGGGQQRAGSSLVHACVRPPPHLAGHSPLSPCFFPSEDLSSLRGADARQTILIPCQPQKAG
jgi:hypothetical protein